ncbi:MAG: peptidylprolyl isomerase [Candidatus Micrarchaeota archaeon]|nr:peptidylprolyl isomerase [Candidatus Micrarchaeota archaeon]
MGIKKGDFIKLSYVGMLEDGSVFDTTDEKLAKEKGIYNERVVYSPILIVVGRQQVIRGLDEALIGMEKGEEKEVLIPPEKAFGSVNNDLINVVPLSYFEKEKINPVPGMFVNVNGRDGIVKSVGAGRVIVDFNHPLAGRTLKYKLKVEEILDTPEKKVKALFEDAGLSGSIKLEKDVLTIETKADPSDVYIFRKQTFLSWIREIKEVNKIKFNEEYELVSAQPKENK